MGWGWIIAAVVGLVVAGFSINEAVQSTTQKISPTAPEGDWDKDKIPNNLDVDDDNDGLLDWLEEELGTDPFEKDNIRDFIVSLDEEEIPANVTPNKIATQSALEILCLEWGFR